MAVLQGNLSEFVKVKPEAKSYYELSAATLKFTLPKPGFLDGVKGKVGFLISLAKPMLSRLWRVYMQRVRSVSKTDCFRVHMPAFQAAGEPVFGVLSLTCHDSILA